MIWKNNIDQLNSALNGLSVKNTHGREISADEGFSALVNLSLNARSKNNKIFLIGNGASASMANHIAADLGKNARIYTEALTNVPHITATANDTSYNDIFAEFISLKMAKEDLLIAISSSGDSQNILNAVDNAKAKSGTIITFSGMKKSNYLRSSGHLNFYIPAQTYGLVETGHAALLHFWVDRVIEQLMLLNQIRQTNKVTQIHLSSKLNIS